MLVRALIKAGWQKDSVRSYMYALRVLAERSTGGYYANVQRNQHDSADDEDNRVLDLAAHVDAGMIVTNDSDLLGSRNEIGLERPRDYHSRTVRRSG